MLESAKPSASRSRSLGAASRRGHRPVPADGLLHPAVLAAIGLLLLNDHILKSASPGVITGKLSDVAGLLFFPLLMQGSWEVLASRSGRHLASRRVLVLSTAFSGLAFSAVKLWEPAHLVYAYGLGLLQSPLSVFGSTGVPRVQLTADPTDLIALPALLVPLALGWRRANVPE